MGIEFETVENITVSPTMGDGGIFQTSFNEEEDTSDSEIYISPAEKSHELSTPLLLKEQESPTKSGQGSESMKQKYTLLTKKVFEADVEGYVDQEYERIESWPVASPKMTSPQNTKIPNALKLMGSFGMDEFHDLSWLKLEEENDDYCERKERLEISFSSEGSIEVYHDSPAPARDISEEPPLMRNIMMTDGTESNEINSDDAQVTTKRPALNDITTTALFDEMAFPECAYVENAGYDVSSAAPMPDTCGQYDKAITFGDIFGKRDFSMGRLIPNLKWSLSPKSIQKSVDDDNQNLNPGHDFSKTVGSSFKSFKDLTNQIWNSNYWSSMKISGENKENCIQPVSSNLTLNSIWKNWKKPYSKDEAKETLEIPNASIESSLPEIPSSNSAEVQPIEGNVRALREKIRLRRRGKELTNNSTRSMENLKVRFDTLKLEFHYKRLLKKEAEDQSYNGAHHKPLREIEFFFNGANGGSLSEVTQLKPSSTSFNPGYQKKSDLGKLKVVNNQLKISKKSSKLTLTKKDDEILDSICKSDNISKVEVLKRMKDGTIKARENFRV